MTILNNGPIRIHDRFKWGVQEPQWRFKVKVEKKWMYKKYEEVSNIFRPCNAMQSYPVTNENERTLNK